MARQILLLVVIGLVVIPVAASKGRRPMAALKRMLFLMVLFNLLYAFAALVVYPRLGVP
jgi:hypothetical protein